MSLHSENDDLDPDDGACVNLLPPAHPMRAIGLRGVLGVQLLMQLDVDVNPLQKDGQDDAQGCAS